MLRHALALFVLGAVTAGCTMAVRSYDEYLRTSTIKEGLIDRPVEEVFECFLRQGRNDGYHNVNSSTGRALWSSTKGGTFLVEVTFERRQAAQSWVQVRGILGGDPSVTPEFVWERRVRPCAARL